MKKTMVFLATVLVLSVGAISSQEVPVAISPGNEVGIATIEHACPTFSWTAVEGAVAYRIEIFRVVDNMEVSYEMISATSFPILVKDIMGEATSWTPSSEERLEIEALYTWFVQAIDEYGNAASSVGMHFIVDINPDFSGFETTHNKSIEKHSVSEDVLSETCDDILADASRGFPLPIARAGGDPSISKNFSILGSEVTNNTFYGADAGANTTGLSNAFFGYFAGGTNTSGNNNTFVGDTAGPYNTTGIHNTFVGASAGGANTTGYNNTSVGSSSGLNIEGGHDNVYMGAFTAENSVGSDNTILGTAAGRNLTTGNGNVFLGRRAGYNETGSDKLYIDNSLTNDPLIWGDFDADTVALMGAVGIGTKSPVFPMEMKKTGTNASIVVDRTDGATNYINATATSGNFGTVTNHVLRLVVGGLWTLRLHTDYSLTMRNGASCTSGGVWTNASSRGLKDDINDLSTEQAMEALNDLQPVTYKYKADMRDEHVGFIAEDVPELVASKDRKGMSPMDVVAVLTKVLQEQQRLNQEQQKTIDELKAVVEQLKNESKSDKR